MKTYPYRIPRALSHLLIVAVAFVLLSLCYLAGVASGQQSAATDPAAYKPTEVQQLRLKVAQQDAMIAQRDLQAAQQRFQQAMSALTAEADKVKDEQHWSKDTRFDANTLTFTAPPAPAPAAPAQAKGDKK